LLAEAREAEMYIVQLPLEMAIVKFCMDGSAIKIKTEDEVILEPVSKAEAESVVMNAEIALPSEESGHVTFKTVEGRWEEVFKRVADAHASLGFLLRSAKLIGVDDNKLRLGFNFKFHADTLNARKNKEKLENILKTVLGSRVEVLGEYVHADADEIVGELVGELGGKIVE
jgi:hypothetical protein